ncbi:MAG: SDR family oxidoreductase [Gemmatimonadales bacterium]|nr:SDR family oxidoreductase [Gemmatimonadales bacterium]MDQ3426383.1 SDR family oxidoreductase [Gemmatimonadota bacterium]
MNGKVCVVTGASRGIGRATVEGLAAMGATVVLVCRRRQDGDQVVSGMGAESRARSLVVEADLSSQRSIRAVAAEIAQRHSRLDVLVNNAGVVPSRRQETVDGLERQFALNHLAYFLLTDLLLEPLRAGAPSRVVSVSSGAHFGATMDFDDLQSERSYSPGRVYAMTKLANILFTRELARRVQQSGITANCLHPGVVATKLLADYMNVPLVGGAMARTFGAKPERGAQTIIYLASSPEVNGVTGKYFQNRRPARPSSEASDDSLARRLWEVSERLTSLARAQP